jgi:hypothetical protein
MRLDEIRKRYRNEWVLVEFSKLDKDLRVKDGKVIAHAPNKDDIYKALLDTRGKNVAVEYCGDIQEDVVVMFCHDVIGTDYGHSDASGELNSRPSMSTREQQTKYD